jgi:ABC-type polysaccharide/polyol phosphate transport system ATPase subunit
MRPVTDAETKTQTNGASDNPKLMLAAIELHGVTLTRRTQEELHYDLKRTLFRAFALKKTAVRRRTVLTDVSLRVNRGEKLGIIGPNGSGKSTLLKVIAGILKPTTGTTRVSGSISPLIELGAGFDAELSLVDNILYYGVLLGHSEALVRKHVDEILDFAELTEYRNEPTKTLSSGMGARLSFAIATEFRPDIILIDEVLSVGDERFRRKCEARISRFWDEHSTILFVSHDMNTISHMCERVVWLDHGSIRFDGPFAQAMQSYLSTVPSVANFRRGEELVALAESNERRELIVRGTSGSPVLYLVRDGRRHYIGTLEWCHRHQYTANDVTIVEDSVILEIPEGDILQ